MEQKSNNFYSYLIEQEEIVEVRGAGRFKAGGKYIPRKVTIRGKEGTFQSTRYFKPKETKLRTEPEHQDINKGWKSSKVDDSFASLGKYEQHRVSKEHKSLDFFNDKEKADFDRHWGKWLSYDDVHTLVNPLGLPGKVEIQQQRNNESFFTINFKGSTKVDANGKLVPLQNVDKKELYQFELSIKKNKDELLVPEHSPSINIEYARVPDKEQGTGFMRKFFESVLPHWDRLGIKNVSLFADVSSGVYSWAKYGFDFHPEDLDSYKAGLQAFLKEKGKKLKGASVDNIKHSWEIAGLIDPNYNHEKYGNQIGKDFMFTFGKNNGWRGTINLEKGNPSRIQFESYVKGKFLPESIKQMQGDVASRLFGHLSPEAQLKALVHDKVRGPLTAIGIELDRGNANGAIDRFSEVTNTLELFAEASKGIEVGLLHLLHKELMSSISSAPLDFRNKLHEKVFGSFLANSQPYLTKMSRTIETKSKRFSESFRTRLKEEAKTMESYRVHGLQGFKHVGKLKDAVVSQEALSYMGEKLNMDVFASNNLNGNHIDGFVFAQDPKTKKPFVAINPLNFNSTHEPQLLVKANEIQQKMSARHRSTLDAIAHSIRNLPIERGVEIDEKGNIIFTKDGTANKIDYTDKELRKLKGKVDTSVHNHPGGGIIAYGPPSFEDLGWGCSIGCKQISTVSQHEGMLYSLRPKEGQEHFSESDMKAYKNMFNVATRQVKDSYLLSILTANELKNKKTTFAGQKEIEDLSVGAKDEIYQHKIWQRFAEMTGVRYSATPIASTVENSIMNHVQKSIEMTKPTNITALPGKTGKRSIEIPDRDAVQDQLKEFMPIADRIAKEGGRAFIVGGFVRDLVMGKIPKDIDVEVHGMPQDKLEQVLGTFKGTHGEAKLVGKAFGVYKLGNFDIAMPRTEKKVGTGHKGFEVQVHHEISIEDASRRRDLKFNSMLYDPIEHKVLDPHGGIHDIKKGEISHTDEKAFAEDPLRVFRVARFASTTGFKVHPDTTRLSKTLLDEISTLPKERIMGEMEKILLKGKKPSDAIRWLDEVGVLEKIMPELHALKGIDQGTKHHPEGSAFEHTMLALDAIPRKERTLPVMLGILAHDLGKAAVKSEKEGDAVHFFGHAKEGAVIAETFLKRLTDETELTNHVLSLVRYHMRPYDLKKELNKTALKRLGLKVNIEDLMKVHLADKMGRGKEVDRTEISHIDKILSTWDEIKHETKPMVLGRHLISMGMKPGKQFGEILNKAFQAQLDGEFNTQEDGIKYVKEKILKKEK